jgi:hypothetical protein
MSFLSVGDNTMKGNVSPKPKDSSNGINFIDPITELSSDKRSKFKDKIVNRKVCSKAVSPVVGLKEFTWNEPKIMQSGNSIVLYERNSLSNFTYKQ